MSSTETPFNIQVPDEAIAQLHRRLELATFPDELDGSGWDYGAPLADVKRLAARWKDGYDWRKSERALNEELPQFTRDIDMGDFGAINVHYVHKKSDVVDAVPLLFVHGWPGSFIEVRKILPLLVEKGDHPSFHVVAISLPNFGFSGVVKKKGFNLNKYAEISHKLMLALGYNEYVTQGGDWGSMITRVMAQTYGPKNVKAWHTNFVLPPQPKLWTHPLTLLQTILTFALPLTERMQKDKALLQKTMTWGETGRGYFTEQMTKPQTLGYSLADSPVGLLAWIYEKLVGWTDGYPWTDEEVLEWISIYYFSKAGAAASVRIYYEAFSGGRNQGARTEGAKPSIPLGVSYFPGELARFPHSWSYNAGNLVSHSEHPTGGHFAAHEKPELLVGDLRKMFGKGGGAFAVVNGKMGYA